ncbi:MAG: ABC transporter permease [Verrucomicrobiales bacterium]
MRCGAVRPSSWVLPVRQRFTRQILFGGVEAIPFTMFAGVTAGIVLTLNSYKSLEFRGQIDFLGPVLSILVIREAAPFFACVIIISASASAITTEIAMMRVNGEVDLIEGQGANLVQFLVMPRAIGFAQAATGLAAMFVACAFAASAIAILMIGRISLWAFFNLTFDAIVLADFLNLNGRSTVPAFLIGVICCHEGLRVSEPVTVVRQAVTKAMLRAVAVTLVLSAAFAVLTYL